MRWVVCLCCISLFAGQLEVEVHARSAILMNADTGAILFEKEAHLPLSPGSTTKIATALYFLEQNPDLTRKITVSKEAMRARPASLKGDIAPWWHHSDGTMMGLKIGEVLTLEALWHGLILVSGNDAANVIAEDVAGSVPEFMERVNEYLAQIGCKNTQYKTPSGLPDPEHWSTAYDLAWMMCKALKFPRFRAIISTPFYNTPATNKQPAREMIAINAMLKPKNRHYYPKAIGGKTGNTVQGKKALVAAAEQDGRTLVVALLGCQESA
ncbi:MAG: D-alanyl-D-alanine carboxypeptidase, partial [Verrucomicrobiota bacterium]|nr:D-alanyl-D-alanine carboxypeptidase [Verrucomicrobiota bacterium]